MPPLANYVRQAELQANRASHTVPHLLDTVGIHGINDEFTGLLAASLTLSQLSLIQSLVDWKVLPIASSTFLIGVLTCWSNQSPTVPKIPVILSLADWKRSLKSPGMPVKKSMIEVGVNPSQSTSACHFS